MSDIQTQIDEIKARQSTRRSKPAKPKKTKSSGARKSFSKASPSRPNGHAGSSKKSKKTKETKFKDDEEPDSEEEARNVTLSQKQELAEKIQQVDEATLSKAVDIIKETTALSSVCLLLTPRVEYWLTPRDQTDEIELDIESLPPLTVYKLYILVCRGGRKVQRAKPGQAKRASGTGKKAGGARKMVNEEAEEDRIRQMEAQLQSFDTRQGGMGWGGEGGDESDSDEEESSDEE